MVVETEANAHPEAPTDDGRDHVFVHAVGLSSSLRASLYASLATRGVSARSAALDATPAGHLSGLLLAHEVDPAEQLELLEELPRRHPGLAVLLLGYAPGSPVAQAAAKLAGPVALLPADAEAGLVAEQLEELLVRRRAFLDRVRRLREDLGVCRPGACGHLRVLRGKLSTREERLRAAEDALARHRHAADVVQGLSEREQDPLEGVVGESPLMQRLCAELLRAAQSDCSVVLVGETGTGKDVAAAAIHAHSARKAGPFVVVNCAALPESLLESELFGHVRGAFTGATADRPGLMLQATGGTLFLDEIGDMPLPLQSKLLRVLQNRTVRPVGSDREVVVDVRLIAATHCDLEAAVGSGAFREDLYYRINVLRIAVPPLRRRGDDVVLLAQAFLRDCAKRHGKPARTLTATAAERLLAYDWPGNVRELRNCINRAVAMSDHEELRVEDLSERVRTYRDVSGLLEPTAQTPLPELATLGEIERTYILRVLERVAGNKSEAARLLGIGRKTLYRKLKHMEVNPDESRDRSPPLPDRSP
jgi:DNA-binding NtrC family response regulator